MTKIVKQSLSLAAFMALSTLLAGTQAAPTAAQPTTEPTTQPTADRTIHVAIYADAGSPDLNSLVVDNALHISPSFICKRVTAQNIRDGGLAGMDVLVEPGGSGSKQAKTLEETGRAKIKEFVKNGGGYVGICAGSYLASSYYTWSLHLLNADVVDSKHWARGFGTVQLSLSSVGEKMLDENKDRLDCVYHQGPLLTPGHEAGLAPYEPLATFATEVAKNGAPPGIMIGTTAMARGVYGKGHVVAISPHPEKTDGLDNIVRRVVEWAATGDVGHVRPPTTAPITLDQATTFLALQQSGKPATSQPVQ